jgi:glycosyltransferase involved in cell wall biosynthesis
MRMGRALVTIGIPTRNRAAFLREAVASAQRQTYRHLEILVIDNASTDETAKIVAVIADPRLRFVRNEADLGMTGGYNRVLDLARGDYVVCLCDGDWLDPAFVEAALGVFRRFPALGLVACPVVAHFVLRAPAAVASALRRRVMIWRGLPFTMP